MVIMAVILILVLISEMLRVVKLVFIDDDDVSKFSYNDVNISDYNDVNIFYDSDDLICLVMVLGILMMSLLFFTMMIFVIFRIRMILILVMM